MTRALCIGLLLLAACGGDDDDDDDIPDQVLSGVVGGDAWTFEQGQVNFVSGATSQFHVGLYADAFTECGQSAEREFLLTSFDPEPGTYPFDLEQNLTFVNDEGGPVNFVATDGVLIVDEVTDETVTGRLRARFDEGNDVAGTFEISTCIVPTAPLSFQQCSFDAPPPIGNGSPPAVQAIAAASDGGLALIDSAGAVRVYSAGAGGDCSFELANTIELPADAEALDYDASGTLYIHTIDRMYRYEGVTETLDCDQVSAADGLAVTADGAVAYSTFVNGIDRITIDVAACAGAVWTPGNAFSFVYDVAIIQGQTHVGGQLNGDVQVVVFDDAGAEQFRYGAGDDLIRASGLSKCGEGFCLLNSSWISVYDATGAFRGTSNIADVVTVEAGFLATDLAFPRGGGPGFLGISAQRLSTLDVEAQIYRVDHD